MTHRTQGFSLIEMAFVLVIVTLLLGGLLVPFATQVEQKRIAETNKALEEIKEALLGFALVNRHLPCPDFDNDGIADPCGGVVPEGNLPWTTLGVANSDAWGNRFRYRVTHGFTNSAAPFTLTTAGVLTVCGDRACGQHLADNIPAVIYSYGRNGQSVACAVITAKNGDECENTDADERFVSRIITGPGATIEYDDLVVWLSPNVLFNRMVAAGRLP